MDVINMDNDNIEVGELPWQQAGAAGYICGVI
jgi:hypothetical protein